MAEDTPPETTPGPVAPSDLKQKGPEDDDAQLVTEPPRAMQPWMHRALGLWFLLLAVATMWCLFRGWPEPVDRDWRLTADSLVVRIKRIQTINNLLPADSARVMIGREITSSGIPEPTRAVKANGPSDRLFFRIALLCGILGACGHGLSSLMDFRGARRLFRSWGLWYFALPVLGGIMAVILFLILRAGLFPSGATVELLSPFGVGAVSALAGLCTDKASAKLGQVLETLFLAKGVEREGKLVP